MKHNKKILAVIPARMGSSRFPGKPLAEIHGKPMIGHVYDNVKGCDIITNLVVATCDNEIYNYVESINGNVVMTSDKHQRATDRCAEALIKIEEDEKVSYDIVIMIQGDEPMVHPEMISQAVSPMLNDPDIHVTNLLGEIKDVKEFEDKNCIKVVCDLEGNAMYFSRQPIPTNSISKKAPRGKQICIIPFRRDFLLKYTKMTQTPLEIAESIDMMRIIENGIKIKMVKTEYSTQSVDTPSDIKKVINLLK